MTTKHGFRNIPILLAATLVLPTTCALGDTSVAHSQSKAALTHIQQAQDTPSYVASHTTRELFAVLKNNKSLYTKDPEAYYSKMEKILDPAIAFKAVARAVMGKYAHRVSSKELNNFISIFRHSLLVYYSKVLKNYDTGNIHITGVEPPYQEQLDAYKKGEVLSVPVDMTVSSGQKTYQLSYSMMEVKGTWKIRNIIIEGINLGLQFRNQFAEAVHTYHSPQAVIKEWNNILQNKPVVAPHKHQE